MQHSDTDAQISAHDLFSILASHYRDKPDDFILSIGHSILPFPEQPIGVYNPPEIHATTSITLADVRRWARK